MREHISAVETQWNEVPKGTWKNCSNEGTAGPWNLGFLPNIPSRSKNTVRMYIIYGVPYTCVFLCRGYVHVQGNSLLI